MLYENRFRRIVAKTASYVVQAEDVGTIFTTRGASGAITFTLPPVADVQAGWYATFLNLADQNLVITAPDEKIVAFNDLTADGVSLATTSEKIGGGFNVLYDGTSYIAEPILGQDSQTVTVTSA